MTIDDAAVTRQSTVHPLWRRALGEFLGTGLLVAVAVGSAIAGSRLTEDAAVQLLASSLATALGLAVLIMLFAPVSEAHFNPVVSLADLVLGWRSRTGLTASALGVYIAAQGAGAIGGAMLANAMFDVPQGLAAVPRDALSALVAEIVATAGLVLVIVGLSRSGRSVAVIATAVGAYIGAAYWFTSSTSFANPAVTIGRIFTDTAAGIAPASAIAFIVAQVIGAAVGTGLGALLFPTRQRRV